MADALPRLRIAIGQLPMRWTGADNTRAIVETVAQVASAGVGICVFPELAVTGFHRQIASQAKPECVAAWLQEIAAACALHRVAVSVGAPTFAAIGSILNSQIFIDSAGARIGVVDKCGLTAPEATFFARGSARPVVMLQGRRCTAVICREVEDFDEVCAQLASGAPDIIFWPGLMGPQAGECGLEPPRHVRQAQRLAKHLEAWVVQANWPNSLNYPEQSAGAGRSAVIRPDGEIAFMLPRAEPGVATFALGDGAFRWQACAA